MHSRRAWLVAGPLALAGCLGGHVLAYRIAEPDAVERGALLTATGHDYLSHLPLAIIAALTLVLAGALRQVSAAASGRGQANPSPWLFAALPPCSFLVQEHLELALHTGSFPFEAVSEPTFVLGLALQLPFALLAYVVTRVLLRAASSLGLRLARARLRARPDRAPSPPSLPLLPRPALASLGHAQRAPPGTG